MKMMVVLAGAGVLALGMSGCSPKLDQPQFSPEEQVWADYIKQNYSAWQPPVAEPRGVRGAELPAAQDAPGAPAAPTVETSPAPAAPEAGFYGPAETPAAASAPAPAEAAVAAGTPADAAPEVYTVVKGDTLGGIARKFYGRASAWKKIQDANEALLKGKTVIRPGMKLTIPKP